MNLGVEVKKKTNPKECANLISLITFFFTYDLLKKGYKNDFGEDDIYDVLSKFKSSKLGDKLEKQWMIEQKNKNPSVYRLLWACYGKYYLLLGLIHLTVKITLVMVQPRVLGRLISYFTSSSKLTKADARFYAVVLVSINVLHSTYSHNYMFLTTELGIRIKTAFCSLLYRKSLKLTQSALCEVSVGKIVTLMSKDVTSFKNAVIALNDMWISLILLVVTSCLMYVKVGIAALAGVLILILVVLLQVTFGKLISSLRLKASKVTDQRLQVTREVLSAIKIVKMYTWEKFLGDKISKTRLKEMGKIKQIYVLRAISFVIGGLVTNLTLYIIVITYTKMGNHFTAEVAVYLMGCLFILTPSVVVYIPIGIAYTAELYASANRIRKVLKAEDQPQTFKNFENTKSFIELKEVAVNINEISLLHDINLTFKSGLNFIAGKVGGGKSFLLKTILKDYPVHSGSLKVQGTLSYASEEPWLFPSSIRQNILFGEKFHYERYKKVLKVCALNQDIDTFQEGDSFIVDDRGMNLSKGQQTRISLARAVYRDSDIYLLDNCLSSLDIHVQDYVFRECVKTFLKDKIVVMVSQNERQIKEGDNVIIMENGTVKSCLNPSQIRKEDINEIMRELPNGDIIDNIVVENEEVEEDTKLLRHKSKQNIYSETKKEGSVDLGVYTKYFQHGGSLLIVGFIIFLFIFAEAASNYSEKMVKNWINIQQKIFDYRYEELLKNTPIGQQNISSSNFTLGNESNYKFLLSENSKVMTTYTLAIISSTVLLLLRSYFHFAFASKASVALHKLMATSVVNATMHFFNLYYIGNVLNRFSNDVSSIDEILPVTLHECLRSICAITGLIILILSVNAFFILPALFIFIMLLFLCKYYIPTGRSLKRLESATRSPFIGHLSASLEGLTIIRACQAEDILRKEFDRHQDVYTSTLYMMKCASRAFAYFSDMLCNLFIAIIIIWFLFSGSDALPGDVGLAITRALILIGSLRWAIKQWADLENYMTSVERVLEYTNVKPENKTGQIIQNWPSDGKIIYKGVSLTYGVSKDYVLKDVTFTVKPREKIGIVGRTGAGKSSIISALFRLYPYEGNIMIDDVDIKTLSLDFLRSSIAIIPQDPILFTGTIRSNIDPNGRYSDEEIWKAITSSHLKDFVTSLDHQITESSKYSSGEKQLICLARAVVSKNKIIILDEATANMDSETDAMIYSTFQQSFSSCTVLTIAHKLDTIMRSDRVMVVDKGQIVEFDNPIVLLGDENGVFYKMIRQANLLT